MLNVGAYKAAARLLVPEQRGKYPNVGVVGVGVGVVVGAIKAGRYPLLLLLLLLLVPGRGWRHGGGGILIVIVGTINMWWHPLLLLVPGVGLVP